MTEEHINNVSMVTGISRERLQDIRNGQEPTADEVLQLCHGFFGISDDDESRPSMQSFLKEFGLR